MIDMSSSSSSSDVVNNVVIHCCNNDLLNNTQQQQLHGNNNNNNNGAVTMGATAATTTTTTNGCYGGDLLKKLYPAVDESRTPLPRAWSSKEKYNYIGLSQNNLRVHYKGHGKTHRDAASVQATHPIPAACGLYYFEVRIVSKGRDGYMGIGLSAHGVNMNRLPGWDKQSYGYHGDDGHSFCSSGTGQPYGPTFTTGDVIGCGVNLIDATCFYTKNGHHLGTAFTDLPSNLYPTVGLQTPGEVVDANFGQEPFVFDVKDVMRELRSRTRCAIYEFPVAGGQGEWQAILNKMVSTYLIHHGYCNTAAAFAHVTEQPFDEDVVSIRNRQKILKLVLAGRMGEAIEKTRRLYPGLLDRDQNLLFTLKCRQFIEMVNGSDVDVIATTTTTTTTTSNNNGGNRWSSSSSSNVHSNRSSRNNNNNNQQSVIHSTRSYGNDSNNGVGNNNNNNTRKELDVDVDEEEEEVVVVVDDRRHGNEDEAEDVIMTDPDDEQQQQQHRNGRQQQCHGNDDDDDDDEEFNGRMTSSTNGYHRNSGSQVETNSKKKKQQQNGVDRRRRQQQRCWASDDDDAIYDDDGGGGGDEEEEEDMDVDVPLSRKPAKKPAVERILEFGRELYGMSQRLERTLSSSQQQQQQRGGSNNRNDNNNDDGGGGNDGNGESNGGVGCICGGNNNSNNNNVTMTTSERNQKMLEDAFSLLAYSNPWASPVGWQLDPVQRETVCASLNSAILETCNKPRKPPLEVAIGHAEELVREMSTNGLGSCAFASTKDLLFLATDQQQQQH